MKYEKNQVRDFWDQQSCGEVYAAGQSDQEYYNSHSRVRYELEPYIHEFARFNDGRDRDVLEIGVGMGADHLEWARFKPRSLCGIDLTPRAIAHTEKRLSTFGYSSKLEESDAENLPFPEDSFDIVYSWGVLHHSPDTERAIREVHRVLRPGGIARIMIYHKYSMTGYLLWLRFALMRGRPFRSMSEIYAEHLESPGTKAYTVSEARVMFEMFGSVHARTQLMFGDLLEGEVGQRHRGLLLTIAKKVWPRWLIKKILRKSGLALLVEATK